MLLCTFPTAGSAWESSLAEKKFTPPPDDTTPVFARPPTTPKHGDGSMRRTASSARPTPLCEVITAHSAADRLRNGLRCVAFTVFFNFCARQPLRTHLRTQYAIS